MNQIENLKTLIEVMKSVVKEHESRIGAMTLEEIETYKEDLQDLMNLKKKLAGEINKEKGYLVSYIANSIADGTVDYNIFNDVEEWDEKEVWDEIPNMARDLWKNDLQTLIDIRHELDTAERSTDYCGWLFHKVYMHQGLVFNQE